MMARVASSSPAPAIPAANPFKLEAVATFGTPEVTCSELQYFDAVRTELSQYLSAFPKRQSRFGGAVPLRGAHGSGKTHLLSWLSTMAKSYASIRATVLYAKADSPSFFDLYVQCVAQLPRPELVALIEHALLVLSRDVAGQASVTEGLISRLNTADDLQKAAAERNIDREHLLVELRRRLSNAQVPEVIPDALLRVLDPQNGDSAYRWIAGDEIKNAAQTGLPSALGVTAERGAGATDRDLAAIQALQTIARLHTLADVPLVLCIDQLEAMLPSDDMARRQSVSSLLKKFVEEIGAQHAVMFIAGNDEVWPLLTRDVTPRFRRREPIIVGNLTAEEVDALLDAYIEVARIAPFLPAACAEIRELSGGNPREILRIAYAAFELTGGDLQSVNNDMLIDSAHRSGTVADRAKLALQIADRVMSEFGDASPDIATGESHIDRVLVKDGVVRAAIVTIRATDKLSEASSARNAAEGRQYCESHWPQSVLIVVAIGYSSAEVRSLLGQAAQPIVFKETTFASELRSILLGLPPLSSTRELEAERARAAELSRALNEVTSRLEALEASRWDEGEQVRENFVRRVEASSRPRREARTLQTRWELIELLDELDEARGHSDFERERELVHSILVSNESSVKAPRIDRIGAIYLDAVRIARADGDSPVVEGARRRLVRAFDSELRPPSGLRRLARDRTFIIGALLPAAAWLSTRSDALGLGAIRRFSVSSSGVDLLLVLAGAGLLVVGLLLYYVFVDALVRGRALARIERVLRDPAAQFDGGLYAAVAASAVESVTRFPQSR